jgi:hypothetical protein
MKCVTPSPIIIFCKDAQAIDFLAWWVSLLLVEFRFDLVFNLVSHRKPAVCKPVLCSVEPYASLSLFSHPTGSSGATKAT